LSPALAQVDLLSREVQFDISAQPLSLAIMEFSDQARVQIISSGTQVMNLRTAGVSGRYRIEDALQAILQGTNLKFMVINQDTISISASQWRTLSTEEADASAGAVARTAIDDRTATRRGIPELLEAVEVTATRIVRDGY